MICAKCGQKYAEGSSICENCDAPIQSEAIGERSTQTDHPGIVIGKDGVLRWVYEMNMWKNPTLVITIWKVLLIAALVPALLVFFMSFGDGFEAALILFVRIFGITAGIVTVLMLLAYPLVALLNGGKYSVVFEMDETSIKHIQMKKQFKRNQVLAMVVVLAGAVSGNNQTTAAGMLAGSKQSSLSCFENVKTIVVHKKRNVLFVNESISHNQVYAEPADFSFVSEYLISRCKKARVTYK